MTNPEFIWHRFLDFFSFFHKRIFRLFWHFWLPKYYRATYQQVPNTWHLINFWVIELLILLLELIGIGELYDILTTIFKRSTTALSPSQLNEAIQFFGDLSIFRKIRIDEQARIGTTEHAEAYVTGYTINTGKKIKKEILIHELVHVIQYQRYGLRYISRALYGQHWGEGYNYGGNQGVKKWLDSDKDAFFFNPEQQAEFITDIYLLSQNKETGYFGRDLSTGNLITPQEILNI